MLRRLLSSAASARAIVLADHSSSALAVDTRSAITAALSLTNGAPVHVFITGPDASKSAATAAKLQGVQSVIVANQTSVPENIAPILVQLVKSKQASYVVAASNALAKSTLPRLAALLDQPLVSDVLLVKSPTTFQRPAYAGNALMDVAVADPVAGDAPVLLTVRSTAFPLTPESESSVEVETLNDVEVPTADAPEWVSDEISKSDRPELGSAKVVVSGGRGLKSGDNFGMLYDLADVLNGAVGASRAAVDAGFVGNDLQIGQTGKVVAPDLYIAVGISGAIQHLAGMKDSKVIVSINKDPEAPIFQVSDYGLVADLFKAVPELTEELKK